MQKYYLESVNENKEHFFIFVLLSSPHILTQETVIVSVLNYNFKIKTSEDKKEVIIEYGQSENLSKSVFSNEEKKVFYIGRKTDADIVITEGQVSREQTMIYFENDNWFIKDGGERPSGSGTWLFINKKYQIQDSFTFKIGPSKMKIDVESNNCENKEDKKEEK
jgi:pSer/pThr/pTyr-binding forkhead associated (FHA) protein